MKKQIFIITFLTIGLTALFGCKKYLEVSPKSTVSEVELFTSEIGFKQALIGAYAKMAGRNLYGDNLSMGFVSALGQNYRTTDINFSFRNTTALNFNSAEVINRTNLIWSDSYATIASLNNILEQIDAKANVFSGNNYALTKAEAMGLRAYLHFELLRLFGPRFQTGASKKAIPYRKVINSLSQVPSTTAEVLNLATLDLQEAESLLKDTDPIFTGDKNRRFYFNYFAAKALQARLYLYMGDKIKAAAAATIVVNSGKFTFVTNAQISSAATSRDRLFSNEQIFSLRERTIKDWTENLPGYFRASGASADDLTQTTNNFNTLYETNGGGSTDFRSVYLLENDGATKYPSKFWQTYVLPTGALASAALDQTVPLIRFSEMHYILAECAETVQQGVDFLNRVRSNRGLSALNGSAMTTLMLTNEITKEYQKEFFAEGQLFYYYKRNGFTQMLFSTKVLSEQNYILPIPDTELEFNPNYN